MEEVSFSAYLPDIQTAISIGKDGGRVKVDIPETEMAALVRLAAYGRGKRLNVTVQIEDEGELEARASVADWSLESIE